MVQGINPSGFDAAFLQLLFAECSQTLSPDAICGDDDCNMQLAGPVVGVVDHTNRIAFYCCMTCAMRDHEKRIARPTEESHV